MSSSSSTDTNIDNYSVDDILTIFNLSDPTLFQIKDVANHLIARMRSEGKSEMANFFEKAKQKLLEAANEEDDDDDESDKEQDIEQEPENWWEQESPIESQNPKLPNNKKKSAQTQVSQTQVAQTSKSLVEYEKHIILEKLQKTELELREMKKENQKLKRQLKLLTEK
jgi:hypothetical protein